MIICREVADRYLNGGSGNDLLHGGDGIDTVVFSDVANQINLDTLDIQNTGDGNDILNSVEIVNAGGGDDTVTGDSEANTLNGENGSDTLMVMAPILLMERWR